MSILHGSLARLAALLPRPVLWKVARRYIAGVSQDELMATVEAHERRGLASTVDILGEHVESMEAARRARDAYLSLARRLGPSRTSREMSIKLTQLGLGIDPGAAFEHLLEVVTTAHSVGLLVCLDMEDSSTTDGILGCYRRLKERHGDVASGLGVAIQAYLHRSPEDVASLLPLAPRIRLCKGIYVEPPEEAIQEFQAVRTSFLALLEALVSGGAFAAIATHDAWLIERAQTLLHRRGVRPEAHEFQMLLGVGEPLRPGILEAGSRLRIYCPFGEDWRAYSLRRLRENPKLMRLFLAGLKPAFAR